MATGEVVGGVFFAGDELLRVEELAVSAGTDFVDDGGFEIDEDGSGNVLARSGFAEEGVEGIMCNSEGRITRHHAIGLNAMFEAVEFPAGITHLDTGLTDVNADDFSHSFSNSDRNRHRHRGKGGLGLITSSLTHSLSLSLSLYLFYLYTLRLTDSLSDPTSIHFASHLTLLAQLLFFTFFLSFLLYFNFTILHKNIYYSSIVTIVTH